MSSSLFAENADGRLVQPLFDPNPEPHDERFEPGTSPLAAAAQRDTLTLDYIADTGDGFDATYAVLYYATSPLAPSPGEAMLVPGQILVLGGDQVYPAASKDQYERRLVRPMEIASAARGDHTRSSHRRRFLCVHGHVEQPIQEMGGAVSRPASRRLRNRYPVGVRTTIRRATPGSRDGA
jgi:hypothetical protein